jgi:tetratricopeptide (TPR) repeat protein
MVLWGGAPAIAVFSIRGAQWRGVTRARSSLVSPQLRIPELVPKVDVRTLPLTAIDGFVLSRVDGRCTVSDIASLTNVALDTVLVILDKLHDLGAVRFADERRPAGRDGQARFDESGDTKTRSRIEADEDRPTFVNGQSPSQRPGSSRRPPTMPPPRRPMSESGISSPPPEMKGRSSEGPPTGTFHAPKPGSVPTRPSGTPSHTPQGASQRPQARGASLGAAARDAHVDPQSANAPPNEHRTNPRVYVGTGRHQASEEGGGVNEERAGAGNNKRKPPREEQRRASAQSDLFPVSEIPREAPAEPLRYDPKELEEDVDLPFERRKQLLDLFYRIDELDYYEALQVYYTAEKKEIRAAYFAFSKVFHPDSMFRKNLGSFKPKMEAVFKFLTEGYETLSRKKNRDEYDAYLRATKATKLAEQALKRAQMLEDEPEPEPPPPPVMASPTPPRPAPPPVVPPREVSPEARRLAQEVVARRLRSVTRDSPLRNAPKPAAVNTSLAPPPLEEPTSTPPAAPKGTPQDLLRRLTRTLKDVGHVTGTADVVGRAVKAAQAAYARGDLADAAQLMAKALQVAPEREDLKAEHQRISKALAEKLTAGYIEQAKFEAKSGKWAAAAASWGKVCEGLPEDAEAHRFAAHALFKAGGDLRGAQKYAQQSVFLAPDDIEGRILLTQIYMTIGLKLNAKRELDAAAKLDSENEIVKNLLADLKKADAKS